MACRSWHRSETSQCPIIRRLTPDGRVPFSRGPKSPTRREAPPGVDGPRGPHAVGRQGRRPMTYLYGDQRP